MKNLHRSARIQTIARLSADHLPQGATFAEIGYDHGEIFGAVLRARPDLHAIGSEILPHLQPELPAAYQDRVSLRVADGLEGIRPGEISLAIMAGIGGPTIADILLRDPALTQTIPRLVLCPSHFEAEIRPALRTLNYRPIVEKLVYERRRYYEIIIAAPITDAGTPYDLDPAYSAWGPRLLEDQDPLLEGFVTAVAHQYRKAIAHDFQGHQRPKQRALVAKLRALPKILDKIQTAGGHAP